VNIYEKGWGLCHKFVYCLGNCFFIKTIPYPNTVCDRYLPEHSITESSPTSYSLLKQLYPEPIMVLYRANGIPVRRVGGYICSKSAVFMARDYYILGGGVEFGIGNAEFGNSPSACRAIALLGDGGSSVF
jgi:hypothetical protein